MCRVLVVDDSAEIREVIGEALSSCGHEVFAATNGEEALLWLDYCDEKQPCMILLDLNMPVMNGWDFLIEFRREPRWKSISVIVFSASLQDGGPIPFIKTQGVWSKPIDLDRLESVHHYCVRHRRSSDSRVRDAHSCATNKQSPAASLAGQTEDDDP